jgi:hypothetical protein
LTSGRGAGKTVALKIDSRVRDGASAADVMASLASGMICESPRVNAELRRANA